ncbi:MAG: NTP transferase domain-containing protein [Terrimesophilobacter sp.]
MLVDAIILTGGRSSRLDSVPKSDFVVKDSECAVTGSTLLDRTLRAAAGSRHIVVVGHEPTTVLPDGVLLVREEPPFSGPVAAIAAGVTALTGATDTCGADDGGAPSDALLVLACDMPHIGLAVPSLLLALNGAPEVDGVIALDAANRRQPLAAVYRTKALCAALEAVTDSSRLDGPLGGLPVFRLLDHLNLVDVEVTHDATADVDTWDDAMRLGAQPPANTNKGTHHG